MKSKEKIFTDLIVKLPKQYRIVPLNALDWGFSGEGEMVSSRVLTSQEYTSSVTLADYAPNKYRRVEHHPIKKIKFEGSDEVVIAFKNKIKELLITDARNKWDCNAEVIDEQVNGILLILAKYDVSKLKRRYREKARKAAIEFYPQMAAFILAKNNEFDSEGVEISFGNIAKSEFKLPAPRGNQHLISAMSKFFLEYYTQNQPAKNQIPLTEDLIFENDEKVKSGVVKFDEQLTKLFHYSFHFSILNKIQTFPQFPVSQRVGEFNLTESQGRFMVRFLHLLNYVHWKSVNYEYISPQYSILSDKIIAGQVSTLRYEIRKYLKLYKNAGDYTT